MSFAKTRRAVYRTRDGEEFDKAAWENFRRRYHLDYQVVNGGAASLTVRAEDIPGEGTYYFAIQVPTGRRLVMFGRILDLFEGQYYVDVVRAADGFTGGTLGNKKAMNDAVEPSVTAVVLAGVTPSGTITELETGILDTGTGTGSGRSSDESAARRALKRYTGDVLIRVQKLDTGTQVGNLIVMAWEEDDENYSDDTAPDDLTTLETTEPGASTVTDHEDGSVTLTPDGTDQPTVWVDDGVETGDTYLVEAEVTSGDDSTLYVDNNGTQEPMASTGDGHTYLEVDADTDTLGVTADTEVTIGEISVSLGL